MEGLFGIYKTILAINVTKITFIFIKLLRSESKKYNI